MKYGGGDELYNQLVEPYGVHLIGSAATGLEAFVTKKPIRTVADLKGSRSALPRAWSTTSSRRPAPRL
jgi:TRAP-type mannitol/chloroaromatic compound transport system substrate-binding protein